MKQFPVLLFLLFVISCNQGKNYNEETKQDFRIVSLASSITKQLVQLGLKDQIAGATSFCPVAKDNKELIIGSATDVNMEKITLLNPDLIFASTLTKPKTLKKLKITGATIVQMQKASSFDEICRQFIKIGKLTHREEKAKHIIETEKNKIDSIRQLIPEQKEKPDVFFQIGKKPLFAVIPNSYMNDLIQFAGMNNIAYDLKHGTISRETVIARNPEVIFVVTMGITGKEEKKTWEHYEDLSAVQNDNVFVLNSDLACTPTPTTFRKTLEIMVQYLYR